LCLFSFTLEALEDEFSDGRFVKNDSRVKKKKVRKPKCWKWIWNFLTQTAASLFSQFNLKMKKWLSFQSFSFISIVWSNDKKKSSEYYSLINISSPSSWRHFTTFFLPFSRSRRTQLLALTYFSHLRCMGTRIGTILPSTYKGKCVSAPLMFMSKPHLHLRIFLTILIRVNMWPVWGENRKASTRHIWSAMNLTALLVEWLWVNRILWDDFWIVGL
jgi:hypothetical protein